MGSIRYLVVFIRGLLRNRTELAVENLARAHLSLDRNSSFERQVEPPDLGKAISIPMVGGLHHRYRRAA